MKNALLLFPLIFLSRNFVQAQNFNTISIAPNAYVFQLDKQTGFLSKQNEVDEIKSVFYRSVSVPNSCIEAYDLASGKLKYVIKSSTVGIDGFSIATDEKLWVHDAWGKRFVLIDKNTQIIKELKKVPRENIDLLTVDERFNPLIVYKNTLLNTGMIFFNTSLDTKSLNYINSGIIRRTTFNNKINYFGKIATNGSKYFYGFLNSYSMCLVRDKLVIAPHFSEELQVYDLIKNTSIFVPIKSKFTGSIKPLGNINDHANFNNNDSRDYAENSYEFLGLAYDKYRDVYYRFVRSPMKDRNKVIYTMYVIDKNFKVLFYYELPKQYHSLNYFITKAGIHISNKAAYNANTNILTYDLFKLNK